jgi:hypothetical protein
MASPTGHPRSQSILHREGTLTTPIQLTDDVQQQVSVFVEDNFDIETSPRKKPLKTIKGRRSARTDFSSWKSFPSSAPSPFDDNEQKQTMTNSTTAFT